MDNTELYFDTLHAQKYRDEGQSFEEHSRQFSKNTATNSSHESKIYDMVSNKRFIPAGRVQAAMGAKTREVSAFNCAVSQTINDDMSSIMDALKSAAMTLRLGTGIGYNFSNLRPQGAEIVKLKTEASGPLSFMKMFDVMASTIASSGHRRGAQMAVMDVSHPDIEKFIEAKLTPGAYLQFNLSVNCTEKFMLAVKANLDWNLEFGGKVYKTLKARDLWNKIVGTAYESAEPGVLFMDQHNKMNNLHYVERLDATNPCAEQSLPPYGLCLLGSFNLPAYLTLSTDKSPSASKYNFNTAQFRDDIFVAVEAYDNVFEKSVYALTEHEKEAKSKRRMGLGMTGIANCIEALYEEPCYGDENFCEALEWLCRTHAEMCYQASMELAKTRGAFALFDADKYCEGNFIKTLPSDLVEGIHKYGIRNSHLVSYAPCGTISQTVGNVSSGVEPVFFDKVTRKVIMKEGTIHIDIQDYGSKYLGVQGRTLNDCTVDDHISVAKICQKYCDSAVSKTVNVAKDCSYEDYERIYMDAFNNGLKGITVYRPTELRGAVIVEAAKEVSVANDNPVEEQVAPSNCRNGVCEM